jgi:hypothetical protein
MEAALMGVPTLSIVPRAAEAAWLPSVDAGWTACAATPEQVERELRAVLARDAVRPTAARPGALQNMIALINELTRDELA